MAIKSRNHIEAGFNMSSMTDLIFLLLLFFILASTMASPNDVKINLPQSRSKTTTHPVVAKVSIDNEGKYFVALGKKKPQQIEAENLEEYLSGIVSLDSTTYIALHADRDVAYREVVNVIDIANQHKMKLVIATKNSK
ncbi:MAG: biopolymer transporter ExbD [Paludibacteraceae bacterium]|nr:biopolymer transporter ExbD [Paludibacteraceae bacterium]